LRPNWPAISVCSSLTLLPQVKISCLRTVLPSARLVS